MSERKSYQVNEVFCSMQGEGLRKGTLNVFVRFSGCNLQCRRDGPEGFDCDTEFESGRRFSRDELVAFAAMLWERETGRSPVKDPHAWVILTGGEPTLQITEGLLRAFSAAGFMVAVETNGTNPLLPLVDWVCCSPKSAAHTIRIDRADEVRVVRHEGQGVPVLPEALRSASYRFVSPAFGADGEPEPGAMATCARIVREDPSWRLSVQDHKRWRVR